jgi:hypothetical protein
MKKITLLLLLLILPGFMIGQNLITNGDFQSNISATIDNWSGYNHQSLIDDGTNGTNVGNINNGEGSLFQEFAAVGSTTYQIKFDYSWVSGTGNYNMTVRFRERPSNTNLTLSNVSGGTLNGTSDGFIVNTTPDIWYNASFNVTVPNNSTIRLLFFKSNGNRPFRVDNVSVRQLHTFTGATDSDFVTVTNWDSGELPDDDDVIIPAGQNVVLNGGYTSGNITIDPAGSLTINGGGSLVLSSIAAITGNITYNRTLQADKWHFVTSPLVGATYNDTWIANNGIALGTGNNRGISTYQNGAADPTTGQWVYVQAGGSGTFDTSKGYSLRRSATGTVSFTGTYPTGAKPATVTQSVNNFNLVGNPYPMYLSIANFFTNNTLASGKLTEETVWIWDQSANAGIGGYVQKTSNIDGAFQVAPGQAFFISSGNASNIIFFQFNGTNQADTFLKSAKTQAILNIATTDGKSNTEMYYLPEGTNDFDNGYDASKFSGVTTNFDVYTSLLSDGAKKLARQVLSNSDMETLVVPVGVKVAAGKELTFTAEAMNFPDGIKLFLEDRATNTFTRLDEANSEYKVTLAEALDGTGRFFLHTKASGVLGVEDVNLTNVSIFKTSNETLRVVGLTQGTASLKLFNILGKQVLDTNFQSKGANDIALPRLATGVYIVQLQTENGRTNKKIILE